MCCGTLVNQGSDAVPPVQNKQVQLLQKNKKGMQCGAAHCCNNNNKIISKSSCCCRDQQINACNTADKIHNIVFDSFLSFHWRK